MKTLTGEAGTGAPAFRAGNGLRHQMQVVAFAGFTVPQRMHEVRWGGRCNSPPQALQNFASAGLVYPQ